MPHGQSIELISALDPARQMLVQQGNEPGVVARLQQMQQLMHQDVLQARGWLPGQFGVQADGALGGVAASPAGPHVLDVEVMDVDA